MAEGRRGGPLTEPAIACAGAEVRADAGVLLGEALVQNTTLRVVDLYNNNLGVEGAERIAEALKVNVTLERLNLDGHPLMVKQLKGEEPVESINLKDTKLGVSSAVTISSLIRSNTATR